MSFVQIEFLIFLAIFLPFYFASFTRLHLQNALVLGASIIFYAWWSKPLVLLILLESLIGYFGAIGIEKWPNRRKYILWGVVVSLLVILGYFKYANFFIDSFVNISNLLGFKSNSIVLDIILPIGISFHTFQTMAYVIDVYRRDYAADRHLLRFTAFTLFFPQLVAGPIERAHDLLPQFSKPRKFNEHTLRCAIHLIIYGYFIKIFIADSAAEIVNVAFIPAQPSGWWTILGTLAFGLQIYGDFLGYSLIAKGIAGLLGFELTWNFAYPYWATSIRDFWKSWHITLSRWLRDYLYIPLGGNRGSRFAASRNTLITMLLGGLWHGANWTFLAWGLFHGLALAAYHGLGSRVPHSGNSIKILGWLMTMTVVYVGWFLFRAKNWAEVTGMLASLKQLEWFPAHTTSLMTLTLLYTVLFGIEFHERRASDRYALLRSSPWAQATVYGTMIFLIMVYAHRAQQTFIYFQF
jgi:D-alanyl-lipoteichoic acid acyltransferase DltB (MBOAT superfamily)